jgi:hypothetical protein
VTRDRCDCQDLVKSAPRWKGRLRAINLLAILIALIALAVVFAFGPPEVAFVLLVALVGLVFGFVYVIF